MFIHQSVLNCHKMDKSLMNVRDRFRSTEYAEGIRHFLTMAGAHTDRNNRVRSYTEWIFHGEQESMNFNEYIP
ncbi:hypothetical protein CIPAW_02G063800 [Carya illinoinensis]|uniref:Uncharacterized protein n=1 Tax=Carya illinoinensis TaxID=32201 RepID=A0A8T1RCD3_CARIL|nr:hypothetical protein CIPAW_02G063800 [Carya illinoinensis]